MATDVQPVAQQKPQKGWFGRNWWWVLLLVILGGFVVCCGVCGLVGFFGVKALKDSEPYQMTLGAVRNDPVVLEKLGKPIDETGKLWDTNIKISVSGNQGEASVMLPVAGPKGKADVSSKARLTGGKWSLTFVEVDFGGGEKHLLELKPDQTGGGLDNAPPSPWLPPGEVGPGAMPSDTKQ